MKEYRFGELSICCPARQNIEPFTERLARIDRSLKKDRITTIQVNVGSLCNQSCIHCHVNGSPHSKHIMPWSVMDGIVELFRNNPGLKLDMTGGSPELHPDFLDFIRACSCHVNSISVRSNLTVLLANPEFIETLKHHNVEIICSFPDISSENTDYQRGRGVFHKSIKALKILNESGYGDKLMLHLVHNPTGFVLPALQEVLENRYRDYLREEYGIKFNNLYVLNNMPIGRFQYMLHKQSYYKKYISLMKSNFNPVTIDGLMCRYILNIGWDGRLYDCDFNNALNLPIKGGVTLMNLAPGLLEGNDIVIGDHCYGCTAMKGSGCYGTVLKN